MEEQDKQRAEIEAKLIKFQKSLEALEQEAEQQKEKFEGGENERLQEIRQKKSLVESKLKAMDQSGDEEERSRLWGEIKDYVKDMDEKMRHSFPFLVH